MAVGAPSHSASARLSAARPSPLRSQMPLDGVRRRSITIISGSVGGAAPPLLLLEGDRAL